MRLTGGWNYLHYITLFHYIKSFFFLFSILLVIWGGGGGGGGGGTLLYLCVTENTGRTQLFQHMFLWHGRNQDTSTQLVRVGTGYITRGLGGGGGGGGRLRSPNGPRIQCTLQIYSMQATPIFDEKESTPYLTRAGW